MANSNATDALGKIIDVARDIFSSEDDDYCVEMDYEFLINNYKESEENHPNVQTGLRQFIYLECSSLGWYPTSNSRYQPFGSRFSTDLFYNICKDTFSNKYIFSIFLLITTWGCILFYRFDKNIIDKNENLFNAVHGGLELNVTNVIFTHGEHDPYRVIGIQNDPNEFSPVFIIPGTFYC